MLLGGGTIVIEGLNLRDVEPGVYEMFCLPLRIVGADGAPARVVLRQKLIRMNAGAASTTASSSSSPAAPASGSIR